MGRWISLFDHIEHRVELGYDVAGIAQGPELVERVGFDRALTDVAAVAKLLQPSGFEIHLR